MLSQISALKWGIGISFFLSFFKGKSIPFSILGFKQWQLRYKLQGGAEYLNTSTNSTPTQRLFPRETKFWICLMTVRISYTDVNTGPTLITITIMDVTAPSCMVSWEKSRNMPLGWLPNKPAPSCRLVCQGLREQSSCCSPPDPGNGLILKSLACSTSDLQTLWRSRCWNTHVPSSSFNLSKGSTPPCQGHQGDPTSPS